MFKCCVYINVITFQMKYFHFIKRCLSIHRICIFLEDTFKTNPRHWIIHAHDCALKLAPIQQPNLHNLFYDSVSSNQIFEYESKNWHGINIPIMSIIMLVRNDNPDSKVHGAHIGPTWPHEPCYQGSHAEGIVAIFCILWLYRFLLWSGVLQKVYELLI